MSIAHHIRGYQLWYMIGSSNCFVHTACCVSITSYHRNTFAEFSAWFSKALSFQWQMMLIFKCNWLRVLYDACLIYSWLSPPPVRLLAARSSTLADHWLLWAFSMDPIYTPEPVAKHPTTERLFILPTASPNSVWSLLVMPCSWGKVVSCPGIMRCCVIILITKFILDMSW